MIASLYYLLKSVENNSDILEIDNITNLPNQLKNNVKVVRITSTNEQLKTDLDISSICGLYSIEKIYKCKEKIIQFLENIEDVKEDKSNEFEVFMQIYAKLGYFLKYSENDDNLYKECNLEGVLLENGARTEGISETLRNMLICKGIQCVTIYSDKHQYNQVCLSGKWYYTDLTSDNIAIKKKERLSNCLLSKNDFEIVEPQRHKDTFGDNHICNETYNQEYVHQVYQTYLNKLI